MDPILAKQIALGDADPITRLPMDDINPGFVPRVLKPLPLVANNADQPVKSKGKSKGRESLPSGGLLNFFG
jgi:exonuclease-1